MRTRFRILVLVGLFFPIFLYSQFSIDSLKNISRAYLDSFITILPPTCSIPTGRALVRYYDPLHTYASIPSGLSVGMGGEITGMVAGVKYNLMISDNRGFSFLSDHFVVTNQSQESDGDGVIDKCDQDKDNDGILDLAEGFCMDTARYRFSNTTTKTLATPTFSPTGGTFDLVYIKESGVALPSIGDTLRIPFTYSGFVNIANGATNLWNGVSAVTQPNFLGGKSLVLNPNFNSIYSNLPAKNTNYIPFNNEQHDRFLRRSIENGTIDQLGYFNISFGALPSSSIFSVRKIQSISGNDDIIETRSQFDFVSGSSIFSTFDNPFGIHRTVFMTPQTHYKENPITQVSTTVYSNHLFGKSVDWRYTGVFLKDTNFNTASPQPLSSPAGVVLYEHTIDFCIHLDSDLDGIPNYLDLDSDNDNCVDAIEGDENITKSNLIAANTILKVGNGSAATAQNLCGTAACINSNGVPNIVNTGGSADIGNDIGQGVGFSMMAGKLSTITTHPANQSLTIGSNAQFSVSTTLGSGTTHYQWQVSTNNGSTWTNIINGGIYSGANSSTLTVSNINMALAGYDFRVRIHQSDYTCDSILSNAANLCVIPNQPTVANLVQPTCAVPSGTIILTKQDGVHYSIDNGITYHSTDTFPNLEPGIYTIRLRGSSDPSCSTTPGLQVTINAIPTPPPAIVVESITQPTCPTPSGTIRIQNNAGLEYSISNGASYQTSNVFSLLEPGNYTIKTRRSNDSTCVALLPQSVLIQEIPTPPQRPIVRTFLPTCTENGYGVITNYNPSLSYSFDPAGPTVNTSGTIQNAVMNTNYKVVANNTSTICSSDSSLPFSFFGIINCKPEVSDTSFAILEDNPSVYICPEIKDPNINDIHTLALCLPPKNGTATPQGACLAYTPSQNYAGNDTICVIICDHGNLCDTAKIVVSVLPKTDTIVKNIKEDIPISVCVPELSNLENRSIITLCENPDNGTVTINQTNGCITYTPKQNYVGRDTFCIKTCNPNGLCDTTILVMNTLPIKDTLEKNVFEDDSLKICRPELTMVQRQNSYSTLYTTANGTILAPTNDSCITYLPKKDFVGRDTVIVRACNSSDLCDTTVIYISVLPKTDTLKLFITTAEIAKFCVPELSNVQRLIAIGTITNAKYGQMAIKNDSCVEYTPVADFYGTDTFASISCNQEVCDTSIMIVYVKPNVNGTVSYIYPDSSISIGAFIKPMQGTVITIKDSAKYGSIFTTHSRTLSYTSPKIPIGTDSVWRKICVQYPDSNICVNELHIVNIMPKYRNTLVNMLPNTTAMVGDTVRMLNFNAFEIRAAKEASNGTVTVHPILGMITYTPDSNFVGSDTFIRKVCIIFTNGVVSCDTTYHIFIVNPSFGNDTITVTQDDSILLGKPLMLSNEKNVSAYTNNGGRVVKTPDNEYIYFPPADKSIGNDTVIRAICDNATNSNCMYDTIYVNVAPKFPDYLDTTTQEIPLTIGDTIKTMPGTEKPNIRIINNPIGGTATIEPDGIIKYCPNPNVVGYDTILREICVTFRTDTTICDTQEYVILILPSEDPTEKYIQDDTVTIVGKPITPLPGTTVKITDSAKYGTTQTNPDGTTSYTPVPNKVGTDTIFREICIETSIDTICNTVSHIIHIIPKSPDSTHRISAGDKVSSGDPIFALDSSVWIGIRYIAKDTSRFTTTPEGIIHYTAPVKFTSPDTIIRIVCIRLGNGLDTCDTSIHIFIPRRPDTTLVDSSIVLEPKRPKGQSGQETIYAKNGKAVKGKDGKIIYTPPSGFIGRDTIVSILCILDSNTMTSVCDTVEQYINVLPKPWIDSLTVSLGKSGQNTGDKNQTVQKGINISHIIEFPNNGTIMIGNDSNTFYFTGTNPGKDTLRVRTYYTFPDGSVYFTENYIVYTVIADIEIPNVITPNGDGLNDKFVLPQGLRSINASALKLIIYNRWGNIVWRSVGEYKDDFKGFSLIGNQLPDGVYYYIIETDDKPKTGFIQIVR